VTVFKTVVVVVLVLAVFAALFSLIGLVFSALRLVVELVIVAAIGYVAYRIFVKRESRSSE
jgi:hypothetical protein